MKKSGILHAELAGHLARLGHTDQFLVVDSGFPVPPGVPVVDLRVVYGLPAFAPVLTAIADEVVVEHALVATELADANPAAHEVIAGRFGELGTVDHSELKRRAVSARFAVRTAEDTPYANVLLTAGVGFPV
ncbi:D-ribose pyranase [Microbacterium kyungheense]|uniref:D-ribose pyranase n=1 Tax=Microbacterium kyungheense TaxID=1263636 RepID=A0A543EAN3_9MICO|nr:D-ribose pyranase [Microbacterium kyungheense]TQM18628.1 D-ribose pyranase [Microbacterium kyungheense]